MTIAEDGTAEFSAWDGALALVSLLPWLLFLLAACLWKTRGGGALLTLRIGLGLAVLSVLLAIPASTGWFGDFNWFTRPGLEGRLAWQLRAMQAGGFVRLAAYLLVLPGAVLLARGILRAERAEVFNPPST